MGTGEAILPLCASCPREDLFPIREQLWRSSAGATAKIFETGQPNPTNSSSGVEVRETGRPEPAKRLGLDSHVGRARPTN